MKIFVCCLATALAGWLCVGMAYGQQPPAGPPAPPLRITDIALVDDATMRVTFVPEGGAARSLDLPVAPLAGLVGDMTNRRPPAPPPAAAPGTAPEATGPDEKPRLERFEGRVFSKRTGERYGIVFVQDSLVQIAYQSEAGPQQLRLDPVSFEIIDRMYTTFRENAALSEEDMVEALINVDAGSLDLRFANTLNLWWVLGVLVLTPVGVVVLLYRAKVSRIQRERDEIAASRRRLVEAREAERRFLSSELHDGPLQELQQVIRFALSPLSKSIDDAAARQRIEQARSTLQSVAGDLRGICKKLIPSALIHFGLDQAVRSHVADFQEEHELKIVLDMDEEDKKLPLAMRLALFRIVQEALTNVARHAEARRVDVTFRLDDEAASLHIADDGRGFVLPERLIELEQQGHLGLSGIAERTQAIGGTLEVASTPGAGTSLRVTAPRPALEPAMQAA